MNKILLSLTTTPDSDYKDKVREIDEFGIEEVAFFPTFLEKGERQELYRLMENSNLKTLPHVHLRDDMEEEEVQYFYDRWQSRLFNVHATASWLERVKSYKSDKLKKIIFVENHFEIVDEFEILTNLTGGMCVDFAHLFVSKNFSEENFEYYLSQAKTQKIGCCHISGCGKDKDGKYDDLHTFNSLQDFEYMREFIDFLPEIVSLELENSLKEQMAVKDFLEKMIK